MANNPTQRIVVAGGGFAGVYTARYLERELRDQPDIEIVLVSNENYFVFQPLLAEVVSGNIGLLDTVSPLNRLLKRTRVIVRGIDSIDVERKTVILSPGFRPVPHELTYDHLVVALGTVTDFRGIGGLYEHALPFKNLADALRLRNHLIHVLQEATIEDDPTLRAQLLTFVVAGGGFSGVEVAAELNDFVRRMARQLRIDPAQIQVKLVHSGKRVLERELEESLSLYAQKILRKRGVELVLEHRLKTATPGAAILDDGRRIATKTLVSTVPSSANPLVESMGAPTQRGRIEVEPTLQVKGLESVWALGDCALVPHPSGQGFAPPTAQHAVREAQLTAKNISAAIRGKAMRNFAFEGLGKMGSLGHHSAVAELLGSIRLHGLLAWLMWRTTYWWKLPGLDRKIKVGLAWALDFLIPPESVQLNVGAANGMAQAHYEPGEVIFRQGDLGDCLYIILEGEVEVLTEGGDETPNDERILASLGPGDYFGELALLDAQTRTATVRCKSPLSVLTLRKAEFTTLAANLPEMRASFEKVMRARLANSAADEERHD